MSTGTMSLLVLIAFIITIAIAFIKKTNTGVLAMFFSMILLYISGNSFKTLVSGFPTNTFVTMMVVTLFFGYYIVNGTIKRMADGILYTFRNAQRFLPFAIFIICIITGATGGPSTAVFVAAMVFPVGAAAGMNPIHTALCCLMGSNCGANAPFGQFGAVAGSLMATVNDGMYAADATMMGWCSFFTLLLMDVVLNIILFFVFKCYKIEKAKGIPKPAPLTPVQKRSAITIIIVLILLIVPPILKTLLGGAWGAIAGYCDVGAVCFLGGTVNVLLNVGEEKDVIKAIPWGSLIMIGGMGMLVGLAKTVGALDILANAVSSVPTFLLAAAFAIIAGIMSLFSSSLSVVFPTMIPIAGVVALSAGINPMSLFSAIACGTLTTAISPLSTGGSLVYSACTSEINDPQKQFYGQFIGAMCLLVLVGVMSLAGFTRIFKI